MGCTYEDAHSRLTMRSVQLVRLEAAIEQAVAQHPDYMPALGQNNWARVADIVHEVVGRRLVSIPVSVDTLSWDGYFVVDAQSREVVGSCAFKTPPNEDGVVEIAYFTYPSFEGLGYATAMATKLIALAAGASGVRQIIAHTLPEASASTRVLEKVGMQFVGEAFDPDDGRVWRWQVPNEA